MRASGACRNDETASAGSRVVQQKMLRQDSQGAVSELSHELQSPPKFGSLRGMSRTTRIQLLTLIVVLGFLGAIAWQYASAFYLVRPYPYNTFLFRPADRFNDFRNLYDLMLHPGNRDNALYQYQVSPFQLNYYVAGLFGAFVLPTDGATAVYLISFSAAQLLIMYSQLRTPDAFASWRDAVIVAFMTYPFLFAFDRANLEAVVFMFVLLFCWAFSRGNTSLAVCSLALAIAMKPFPVVFLVLFIRPLRLKALLGTVAIATLLSAAAILTRLRANSAGAWEYGSGYQKDYAIGADGLAFGHSLWGFFKICIRIFDGLASNTRSWSDLKTHYASFTWPYLFVALLMFALLTLHVVLIEQELWRKMAILVCAMNLLPFVSGDYKLLHLYAPLLMFLNGKRPHRLDWLFTSLFGLLLIPKPYYHYYTSQQVDVNGVTAWKFDTLEQILGDDPNAVRMNNIEQVTSAVVLNPLLMMTLVVAIIASSWLRHRREAGTKPHSPPRELAAASDAATATP